MAPDPNGFNGSYTSFAQDCRHVIHYSISSELELRLSRPADTYGTPADWEEEYPPVDFVCISANTFLCPTCEQAIRDERAEAEEAYQFIYDNNKGDATEEGEEDSDHSWPAFGLGYLAASACEGEQLTSGS